MQHVGSRGVDRQTIFVDRHDRSRFLTLLADVVAKFGWRCLSYCLMTNHFHLVIELRQANLSAGMQSLNGRYAQGFNVRHGRVGHLFERRFWSRLVTREAHILALAVLPSELVNAADGWPVAE